MKVIYSICLLALFISIHGYGQKKIHAVPIQESELKIEAEASSVSKVKITITPTIDFDKDKLGTKLPIQFEIAPFNKLDFKAKLLDNLKTLYFYQGLTTKTKGIVKTLSSFTNEESVILQKFIQSTFSDKEKRDVFNKLEPSLTEIKDQTNKQELIKIITKKLEFRKDFFGKGFYAHLENFINYNKSTSGDELREYIKSKQIIDERIENLFQYFEAQITLLFKYDLEPVAGVLHYNTEISNVQYYGGSVSERYYDKRTKNYHKLIKKLHKLNDPTKKESPHIDSLDATDQFDTTFIKKHLINNNRLDKNVEASIKKSYLQLDKYILTAPYLTVNDFLNELKKRNLKDYLYTFSKNEFDNKYIGFLPVDKDQNEIPDNLSNKDSLNYIRFQDSIKKYQDSNNDNFNKFRRLTNNLIRKSIQQSLDGAIHHKLSEKMIDSTTRIDQIKKDLKKELITNKTDSILALYKNRAFEKNMLVQIVNHFKYEGTEIKAKYYTNPKEFLVNFENLIYNYKNYGRGERKDILRKKLLTLKNNEIYKSLAKLFKEYDTISLLINDHNFLKSYYLNNEILGQLETKLVNSLKKYLQHKNRKRNRPYADSNWGIINVEVKKQDQDDDKSSDLQANLTKFHEKYTEINDSISTYSRKNKLTTTLYQCLENQSFNKENSNAITPISKIYKLLDQFENCEYLYYEKKAIDLGKIEILESKRKALRLKIIRKVKENPLWNFKADDIQLDINDGFIEHMVVTGQLTGVSKNNEMSEDFNAQLREFINKTPDELEFNINKQLKFTNTYPFGFSSIKDFEFLKKMPLYVYYGSKKQYEFEVEKILPNYIQRLQNDRLDFSPKDQPVTLPEPGKESGSIDLKKEKSSKLFNIIVYTDFNGLKAADPNGVIQMEIDKKISLYTKKIVPNKYLRTHLGIFNHITPNFRWSRLDASNDEKNLILKYIPVSSGGQLDSIPYVTQLDLLRHENIGVGVALNLGTWDLPLLKLRIETNIGGKYNRVKVLDTNGKKVLDDNDNSNIKKTYDINTWRFYPEFKAILRPEERYGADLSFRVIRLNSVTNEFSNISSEEKFRANLTDTPKWLHQIEVNAHLSPSAQKDNLFFFRYRYTNTTSWEYNGFGEIQVGYSMLLKI